MDGISPVQFDISQVSANQLSPATVSPTPPSGPLIVSGTGTTVAAPTFPVGGGVAAVGGHHHHHRPHAMASAVGATSQLLGTSSTTDILAALKSGQSLASIASSKGVSQNALANAIAAALQQSDSSLSSSDAAQVADRLVTATRPNAGSQGSQWGIRTSQSGSSTVSFGA